jgi:hypothetical protein
MVKLITIHSEFTDEFTARFLRLAINNSNKWLLIKFFNLLEVTLVWKVEIMNEFEFEIQSTIQYNSDKIYMYNK